ncbi:MAG: hypothetical protein QM704_06060 [Anaeromyxobacteraceae bacterium]
MLDAYERALPIRLALGLAFFAVLALREAVRRGRQSPRLREYAFLLAASAGAIIYAILNDELTAAISPGYFLEAKGVRASALPFRLAVALVAVKGSYWVGLLLGTALLVANNPSSRWPPLPYASLGRIALVPVVGATAGGLAGGALFRFAGLGLEESAAAFVGWGPEVPGFLTAWGVHAGSYAGAALGGMAAVILVIRARRGAHLSEE